MINKKELLILIHMLGIIFVIFFLIIFPLDFLDADLSDTKTIFTYEIIMFMAIVSFIGLSIRIIILKEEN